MQCSNSCNACSQDCSGDPVDIEDLSREELIRLLKLKNKEPELETLAQPPTNPHVNEKEEEEATDNHKPPLRSRGWFDRKDDPGLTALYLERFLNYGFRREELRSGKPIIGIAQSGSDLTPCNRHHLELAKRVREGIRTAGGIALEFPTYPIQETDKRPTAALDRNLAFISLVEILAGYPIDGVVLLTGCDKTTPAFLMAASQVNIPTICLNVGPMLNGWARGERVGSGTVVWAAQMLHAAGQIESEELIDMVADGTPSAGHCNTMGTALSMNLLAETLGMALPGSAAIPAVYRQRAQCAYQTGLRIVELVCDDIRPRDIMTRQAFENAIVVNSAIGGSTNAPIHIIAVAAHLGIKLDLDDWDRIGFHVPLLVNMQPAGSMLAEDFYQAGGLPAVVAALVSAGKLPYPDAMSVSGQTIGQNASATWNHAVVRPFSDPLRPEAGFLHLRGNIFDSAIIKMSGVTAQFRNEFLENPTDPNAFECPIAVFDGPEDYKKRVDEAQIDRHTMLVMRGCGPLGYPGAAEVVNMYAPRRLLQQGTRDLPCMGDGRQSGTSGCPSILHASPEAAAPEGNLALLKDGDWVRVDLAKRQVNVLLSDTELKARRQELEANGGYPIPESYTYWQHLYRRDVSQLSEGMVMKEALRFQNIAQDYPEPRDFH